MCEGTLDEDLADLDVLGGEADPFGSVALPDVPIGMPAAAAAEPAAPAAAAEVREASAPPFPRRPKQAWCHGTPHHAPLLGPASRRWEWTVVAWDAAWDSRLGKSEVHG